MLLKHDLKWNLWYALL